MLNPRVHLARLLCKQVRCGRVPPPIRMVAPASLHLQPKLPTLGGSRRSFVDGMGEWLETANELMSKLANADGTINLVQRVALFKILLLVNGKFGSICFEVVSPANFLTAPKSCSY